jgi:proteasome lid subunit RPN8/RPN11
LSDKESVVYLGPFCSDAAIAPRHIAVLIPADVLDSLVDTVGRMFPTKAFGYFVAPVATSDPTDYILFQDNHRNEQAWKPRFESYGEYFVTHSDAGFVASPEESLRVERLLSARRQCEVGVFHSHQRHPVNFSQIDYDLHIERFPRLWHLIISMRNRQFPQVRAFDVSTNGVQEIPILTHDRTVPRPSYSVDA